MNKENILVEVIVNRQVEKVWEFWTNPKHIINWNFASDDWCCPKAHNDLRIGGEFTYRMSAKDDSFKFDFRGRYTKILPNKLIEYVLEDKRKVSIQFISNDKSTKIIEKFETESENSNEKQKEGWQAILNNFKKYVENKK
ncbi:MAG: SRPBCC domain-containing protein [Nanoarchaeota archaeon]|nr:SRPBCC domain-containing protein [Nanoarchaeota archaeon]